MAIDHATCPSSSPSENRLPTIIYLGRQQDGAAGVVDLGDGEDAGALRLGDEERGLDVGEAGQ